LENSLQIARRIKDDYSSFKSFVIFNTYEDLEYISTALSFICKNLRKLVIYTGGLDPINKPNSDSAANLGSSIVIAQSYSIPEVTVFHCNYLYRANRISRFSCKGNQLFKSLNYPPLGTCINRNVEIYWTNVLERYITNKDRSYLELEEVLFDDSRT
jgi:L-asparaginase